MRRGKRNFIAEKLLEQQLITSEQLELALEEQKKSDKKIGQILVDFGFITEPSLLNLLSQQLHVPYIDLKAYQLDPETVRLLPEFYCRQFRAIVLKKEDDHFLVGMAEPQDFLAKDEIERLLKSKISIALIREEDLLTILDNTYRRSEDISHFAETLSAEIKPNQVDFLSETQAFSSEDMPVVNLLRSIFEDAVQINASDIHIEPGEKVLRIRLRVDGVLQEQIIQEKDISQALIQRIKLMAKLNIAEKRLPQDGRFTINIKHKNFDVRVSTLPIQFGESLVMRLLNQSADLLKLDQVGMPENIYQQYQHLLHAAYGLLLIVGPTGSGKTTTLYASLNELNSAEDKIITVEDPVEYRLTRINQVQVNPQIDLTFASVLRAILRQDPDIIMIGEIRDEETAEIALRSAMTGHFVLGTLHTNDTISSVTRLLDMGVEGYLIASVLRAILAQRLVRRICKNCIADTPLTPEEKIWLQTFCQDENILQSTFKKGKGCPYCHKTGYLGRIGVYELLILSEELANALRKGNTSEFNQVALNQPTYRTLLQSGIELAYQGKTTIQEVIHMAGEI